MNKYKRLTNNSLVIFFGNFGSKLISLLMLPFYTRWLSVADFGTVDLIGIYVAFLAPIITCSISEAIFIFPKSVSFEKQSSFFTSGLLFSFFSFIITALFFYVVKTIFNQVRISNVFTEYTSIIYWFILVSFLQTYLQQFARSIDKLKVYSLTGIFLTGFTAVFAFILIPDYGIMGFIISQLLALFISAIYTLIFSGAFRFIRFKNISVISVSELLKFSIPLIPNGIMWWMIGALNRPVMEKFLSLDAVGLFAVANKLPSIIAMVFSVFFYSWQISVIEEFHKPDYKLFFNKIFRIMFSFLILLSLGLTMFSKPLIKLFADDKFLEAWLYVPILSIAVIFSSISGIAGANFSASRESKYFFYTSIWGAIVSLVANFILIPAFQIFGAALSVVLGHMAMSVSRIIYAWKYVQLTNIIDYFMMIMINVITIILTMFIQNEFVKLIILLFAILSVIFMNRMFYVDIKKLYSSFVSPLNFNKMRKLK